MRKEPGSPGVFDVSKPGSAQIVPSSNSRPVMITNRPVMKDPMVNDIAVQDPKPEVPKKAEVAKKLVIQPLHEGIVPEKEPEPIDEAPDDIVEEPADAHEPVLPAGVPVPKDDKQLTPEQAEAAQKATQEHAEKLRLAIEKEQYFLPINSKEEKRSRRIAIFGLLLIVLLALMWYDIAIDAGLLTNMYNLPHTHFFTVT